jgi:hypothetical protein
MLTLGKEHLSHEFIKITADIYLHYCFTSYYPLLFDDRNYFNGPKGDELQKIAAQKTATIWPDQVSF